jgi:glycosyltransferase involved in cell wall biosynthesis
VRVLKEERVPSPSFVLMTADTIGGVWTYALDLARGLGRSGTRTVLATMGRHPSEAQRAEAAAVPGLILEESEFRLEWMPEAGDHLLRAGDWLLDLERRYRPDVVHLNGFAHAAIPWQAPRVVVAHSCVLSWWRAVKGEAAPAMWKGYAQAAKEGLQGAEVTIAPTAAFLRDIDALYGPLPRARVVRNGCEAAHFVAGRKRELIFNAGRIWDEAKNVAALDAVAPRLAWPVIVAGDWRPPEGAGDPPENLLCLNVLERRQVQDWLSEAAIFASPARYEPFGLTALEAALSGCALVLGDIPTQRELWQDAALFVPPDDRDALHEALAGLIATPERRNALGEAARKRALRYGLERTVRGYLAAYAEAVRLRALTPPAEAVPAGTAAA